MIEFGGGTGWRERIVHRHARHDARHHRPDQCDRRQDRERNRKNESPSKAAATLRRAVLNWLKQNRRMAHGGWPNFFWSDAGPSTIYVKEALTMRPRASGLGICAMCWVWSHDASRFYRLVLGTRRLAVRLRMRGCMQLEGFSAPASRRPSSRHRCRPECDRRMQDPRPAPP